MDIDNNGSSGSIATDSAGTSDTATSASPASAATSSESAPSSVDAAVSTGPASAATQTIADNGSLTPPDTTLQAANQAAAPAQPAVDYEKRYADLRREQAKWQQERQQYQQQVQRYQGVDPNAVRQWQQAQQRAQQEQLPPWNRNHPANARFNEAKVKWTQFRQAIQRADTPEAKQWVQQTLGSQFQDDDLRAIQAWEQHQRSFQEGFASDPEGSIADIVDRRVQQALETHQKRSQAEQTVGQWFDDAQNKPLIERYRSELIQLGQSGATFPLMKEWLQMKAKLDGLQSRVGEADKAKTAADEQSRLLKGNAAVTRDPKTKSVVDPMVVAKERNIQPGTPDYWDLLTELHSQGLLPK
jgi:hypothetical protein